MMPSHLDADHLYLFAFGPDMGESIAIRIPPDLWVVVDSCRVAGKAAAMHVLPKYGGRCECIVLTHRHKDHYAGFSRLLAYEEWRIVGCDDLWLEDGGAVHRMLGYVDAVYLTGMPCAHDRQMEQPRKAFRRELLQSAPSFELPGGIQGAIAPVRDDLSHIQHPKIHFSLYFSTI